MAAEMGLSKPEDWQRVRLEDVRARGGGGLLARYNNSLAETLAAVYRLEPATAASLCAQKPRGHWASHEHCLAFARDVERRLGIEGVEGWRGVTSAQLKQLGGAGVLRQHGNSMLRLVRALVPGAAGKHAFELRDKVPNSYWAAPENRRAFLEHALRSMGLAQPSSWGRLRNEDVRHFGGRGLLARYDGSLVKALEDAFPEWSYTPGGLSHAPSSYWASPANRRAFLEELARKKGVTRPEDWREVTTAELLAAGGSSLLQRHGSLPQAVEDLFPEYGAGAAERLRKRAGRGHWEDPAVQRALLDGVAEELGIRSPQDWQRVSTQEIVDRGGASLLRRYPSFRAALEALYPEHDAADWAALNCRPRVPSNHWEDPENVRRFLDDARRRLCLRKDEDWARVSKWQLGDLQGASLLRRMPLADALELAFPGRGWQELLERKAPKKAAQSHLFHQLRAIVC